MEFSCTLSSRCIPIQFVNNNIEDCPGGEDERVLKVEKCRKDFFRCSDKSRCLPGYLKCDGVQNCGDGSDESEDNCGVATMYKWSGKSTVLIPWSLLMRKFTFNAVSSIYGVAVNPEFSFSVGFKCLQRLTIQDYFQDRVVVVRGVVPQVYLNKQISVCADKSDTCYDKNGSFKCARCLDGVVISKLQVCDGVFDCTDLSDECSCTNSKTKHFCDDNLPVMDPQITFKKACGSGMVEEIEGTNICETNDVENKSYYCANSTTAKGKYCDGKIDCLLMDDECQLDCYLMKVKTNATKWQEIISSCFKFLLTHRNLIGFEFTVKHAVNNSSNKELINFNDVGSNNLCYSNITVSFAPSYPFKSRFKIKSTLLSGPIDMSEYGGKKGCKEEQLKYSYDLNYLCGVGGVDCLWQKECGPGEWVPANKVCDYQQDCVNWSDEIHCSAETHFYCKSGIPKFVPRNEMVQGLFRCEDHSTTTIKTIINKTFTKESAINLFTTDMTKIETNGNIINIQNLNTNETRIPNTFSKKQQQLVEGISFRVFHWIFLILVCLLSIVLIINSFNSIRKLFPGQSYEIFKAVSFSNVAIANLIFGIALIILGITTLNYESNYSQNDSLWRSSITCSSVGVMFVLSEIAATNLTAVVLGWSFYVRLRPERHLKLNARIFAAQIILSWLIALFFALVPIVMPESFYIKTISNTLPDISLNNISLKKNVTYTKHTTFEALAANSAISNNSKKNSKIDCKSKKFIGCSLDSEFQPGITYYGYYNDNSLCFPSWFVHSNSESLALTLAVMLYIFIGVIVFITTNFSINFAIKQTNSEKSIFSVNRIVFMFSTQVISWIAILTSYVLSITTFINIQTTYLALLVIPLKTVINSLIMVKIDLFFKQKKSVEDNDDVAATEMNTLDDVIDIRYTVENSE